MKSKAKVTTKSQELIATFQENRSWFLGCCTTEPTVAFSLRGWSCTVSLRSRKEWGKEKRRMFYVFVARAPFIVTPHLTARPEIDDNCALERNTPRMNHLPRSFPPCAPTSLSFLGPMTRPCTRINRDFSGRQDRKRRLYLVLSSYVNYANLCWISLVWYVSFDYFFLLLTFS